MAESPQSVSRPDWWQAFTREIEQNKSCLNTCLATANRYFQQYPQDVQRMWGAMGISNEQIAGVNGRPGLQNTDTGSFLVAAALMENSGVALDRSTSERAITNATTISQSSQCSIVRR
jgi:hypothetical protein